MRELKSQIALRSHHRFLSAAAEDGTGAFPSRESLARTECRRKILLQLIQKQQFRFFGLFFFFFYNLKHQQQWEKPPRAPGLCGDPTEGLAGTPSTARDEFAPKFLIGIAQKSQFFSSFAHPGLYEYIECICVCVYF